MCPEGSEHRGADAWARSLWMGFLHMVGVGPGSPGGFERIKSSSTPSLEIFGFFLLLPAFLR